MALSEFRTNFGIVAKIIKLGSYPKTLKYSVIRDVYYIT